MFLYLIAFVAPFVHILVQTFSALFQVYDDCGSGTVWWVDGATFTSRTVCLLTHPDFLYCLFILNFFAVPVYCACFWGNQILEDYLRLLRRIHDFFIRSLIEFSAVSTFLLALFLIVTWSLGPGFKF